MAKASSSSNWTAQDFLRELKSADQKTHFRIPSPLLLELDQAEAAEALIRSIAMKLLCETGVACQNCRGCKKVRQGFHPDWLSIDGSLKMDELRDCLRALRQKPFEAGVRLLTISNFDEASAFVQNALLKIFEEPEAHWHIVGVLKSRRRLLSTLRSRCLFLNINSLEKATVSSLSIEEMGLFLSIKEKDEVKMQPQLEVGLKDRQKARSLCLRLLQEASRKEYPEHWKYLAPELEQFSLAELERNLHPKIVWEKAWAKSLVASQDEIY